ncbi:MAG: fatty acid desaturase [Candidatus Pacebacteria bacterium]|nr:fatty acid desaturase [Candidatus Paceibacterota bacterium]
MTIAICMVVFGPSLRIFGFQLIPELDFVNGMLCMVFYEIKAYGITVGYHRYFTHKSFEADDGTAICLGIAGGMGAQGGIKRWAGNHRRHHWKSDTDEDISSPWYSDNIVFGLCFSHLGWVWTERQIDDPNLVRDLAKNPIVKFLDKYAWFWPILGFILPAIIAGLITWSFKGAWGGFLWGGVMSTAAEHQFTFTINSICHVFGSRPFDTGDMSGNVPILSGTTKGENYHNNHHEFEESACHGLLEDQYDPSWELIKKLADHGHVWNIRIPSREKILKRLKPGSPPPKVIVIKPEWIRKPKNAKKAA